MKNLKLKMLFVVKKTKSIFKELIHVWVKCLTELKTEELLPSHWSFF
jgi:hypothetical protein